MIRFPVATVRYWRHEGTGPRSFKKWGHPGAMLWQHGDDQLAKGRISGEGLERPAAKVITTLLHEGAPSSRRCQRHRGHLTTGTLAQPAVRQGPYRARPGAAQARPHRLVAPQSAGGHRQGMRCTSWIRRPNSQRSPCLLDQGLARSAPDVAMRAPQDGPTLGCRDHSHRRDIQLRPHGLADQRRRTPGQHRSRPGPRAPACGQEEYVEQFGDIDEIA